MSNTQSHEKKCIAAYELWKASVEEGSKFSSIGYADNPRALKGFILAEGETQKTGEYPQVGLKDCFSNDELGNGTGGFGARIGLSDACTKGVLIAGYWTSDLFTVQGSSVDPRTGNEVLILKTLDRTGRVRTLSLPRGVIAGSDAAFAAYCADRGFIITSEKQHRRELQELLQSLYGPRITFTEKTGWIDETAAFVLPSGEVLGEDRRVLFATDRSGAANTVSAAGNFDEWREAIAKTVPGNSRLELALCAAVASPLMRFMVEPACVVFNIHGESSLGKTTSGYVFGSVWGGHPTRPLRYAQSWNQTYNTLNSLASSYSGIGLSLDELQHCPNPDIAYSFSEGEDKGRLKADASQKAKRSWQCVAWSTGEKRLEDIVAENRNTKDSGVQSGREARFFDIPVKATGAIKGVIEDLNGFSKPEDPIEVISKMSREHYGHAGPAFVCALSDYLTENGEEALKAKVADESERVLAALDIDTDANPLVKRVARQFAQVGAAGLLASEFGVIPLDQEVIIDGIAKCFNDWLAGRGSQHFTRGETKSVVELRNFIQSKRHLFLDPDAINDFKGQEIVGYSKRIDGKHCYLLTSRTWEQAQKIAKSTNLAEGLDQRGLLIKSSDGRSQIQTRIKGADGKSVRERFYAVSADIAYVADSGEVIRETADDDEDSLSPRYRHSGSVFSVSLPSRELN